MGWGRMFLLGNIGQQLDIQDTQSALGQIAEELRACDKFDRETEKYLAAVARENAELKLYLAAVIRLLVAKGAITEAELTSIVDTIDRSDGKADGGYMGNLKGSG